MKTLTNMMKATSFIFLRVNNATGIGRVDLRFYKIAGSEYQVKVLAGLGFSVVKIRNWKRYSCSTILANSTEK